MTGADQGGPGPTFVGIGMMKAGTTLVHRLLEAHPHVATPRWNKEVSFFDLHHDRGLGWYRSHFDFSTSPQAWGDLTPGYVLSSPARQAIAALAHAPVVLVCLRDPVARLSSQYLHDRATLGTRLGFEDYLASDYNQVVTRSRYAQLLRPWVDEFGAERLLLFVLEDYQANPQATATALLDRLDLSPLSAAELERIGKVNEAVTPRNRVLAGAAHRTQVLLRRRGLYPLAGRLAHAAPLRRLVFHEQQPQRHGMRVPNAFIEELRNDSADLTRLLGRDFGHWPSSSSVAAEDHPAEDHPAEDHPAEEHAADDHPADDHGARP